MNVHLYVGLQYGVLMQDGHEVARSVGSSAAAENSFFSHLAKY